VTPLPCDEAPPAPTEPDEATRVARWLSAELGRAHVEREAAHRQAVGLVESLDLLARIAGPRLSVLDLDFLAGTRERAAALVERLAPEKK
jgi:hypothetical protein